MGSNTLLELIDQGRFLSHRNEYWTGDDREYGTLALPIRRDQEYRLRLRSDAEATNVAEVLRMLINTRIQDASSDD